jgi:hypothetical protein
MVNYQIKQALQPSPNHHLRHRGAHSRLIHARSGFSCFLSEKKNVHTHEMRLHKREKRGRKERVRLKKNTFGNCELNTFITQMKPFGLIHTIFFKFYLYPEPSPGVFSLFSPKFCGTWTVKLDLTSTSRYSMSE